MFEDYFISIRPFIDILQLLQESQKISLARLSIKYQNKTNFLLNIMKFGVYF
jgi:hypothetical protein